MLGLQWSIQWLPEPTVRQVSDQLESSKALIMINPVPSFNEEDQLNLVLVVHLVLALAVSCLVVRDSKLVPVLCFQITLVFYFSEPWVYYIPCTFGFLRIPDPKDPIQFCHEIIHGKITTESRFLQAVTVYYPECEIPSSIVLLFNLITLRRSENAVLFEFQAIIDRSGASNDAKTLHILIVLLLANNNLDISPSFAALSRVTQDWIREGMEYRIKIADLISGEAPVEILSPFKQLASRYSNLQRLLVVLDGLEYCSASSLAQMESCVWWMKNLPDLASQSEAQVYLAGLSTTFDPSVRVNIEHTTLLRLALMTNFTFKDVCQSFQQLSNESQMILIDEFALNPSRSSPTLYLRGVSTVLGQLSSRLEGLVSICQAVRPYCNVFDDKAMVLIHVSSLRSQIRRKSVQISIIVSRKLNQDSIAALVELEV